MVASLFLPPGAGPAQESQLEAVTGLAPFVNDVVVEQRDRANTFLTDVSFLAGQVTGDKLSLAVEWQIGGTSGTWNPATPQTFDRKHDPEDPGGIIRRVDRRGLEGYWRFEQDFLDTAEFARPLTEIGTVPFTTGGVQGDAVQFANNSANYLQRNVDDPTMAFAADDDFTLRVWVRWTSIAGSQTIIEKFTPPSGPGWSLTKLVDSRIQFHYGGPPGLLIETSGSLAVADATWHQIVVRRRTKVLEVFYDGAKAALVVDPPEPITPLAPSTNFLTLGRRSNGTQPLDADVDEVAIWTRSLSNAEVVQDYAEGAGRVLPGTETVPLGLPFNFVWDTIRDLPEGEFEDVFVRVSVSNNPTTSVIVGPLSIATVALTSEDALARNLQRRALADRVDQDFLGCGLLIPFCRGSRDFENACGVELVRSSVRQILGTRAAVGQFPGDLPWRPDFGNKIWILRHRNNDRILREEAVAFVQEALRFEPRVEVTEVVASVNPEDPNRLDVTVRYRIIKTNTLDNRVFLPEFEEVVTI